MNTEIELPEFFLNELNRVHARATKIYGELDQRALDLLENKKLDDKKSVENKKKNKLK